VVPGIGAYKHKGLALADARKQETKRKRHDRDFLHQFLLIRELEYWAAVSCLLVFNSLHLPMDFQAPRHGRSGWAGSLCLRKKGHQNKADSEEDTHTAIVNGRMFAMHSLRQEWHFR